MSASASINTITNWPWFWLRFSEWLISQPPKHVKLTIVFSKSSNLETSRCSRRWASCAISRSSLTLSRSPWTVSRLSSSSCPDFQRRRISLTVSASCLQRSEHPFGPLEPCTARNDCDSYAPESHRKTWQYVPLGLDHVPPASHGSKKKQKSYARVYETESSSLHIDVFAIDAHHDPWNHWLDNRTVSVPKWKLVPLNNLQMLETMRSIMMQNAVIQATLLTILAALVQDQSISDATDELTSVAV